jgi:hypothetical protein
MLTLDQLKCALNLRNIQRFQTHELLKIDHVDRHSFRALWFYTYFGGKEPLAMASHDFEESITGDLPSPIKIDFQDILNIYEMIRVPFQDPREEKLGKMCDKLDLVYILIQQENSTGLLPEELRQIYEDEREKVLDIAKELGIKGDVVKLLKELKKPFNRMEIVDKLKKKKAELEKK